MRFINLYATNSIIQTSDARQKKNIQNSDLGLDFINKLRPVSYIWKSGPDDEIHYGLIAQETEKAISEAKQLNEVRNVIVSHDEETDRYGLRYTELLAPIIKAIQEIYTHVMGLESDIAKLEAKDIEIQNLKKEMAAIKIYLCSRDESIAICK